MKQNKYIQVVHEFFEETIWHTPEKLPWWKDIAFGLSRFFYLLATGITKNKTAVRATALSYTTLLSIVPLFAVMMAVFKAFGGFGKVQEKLQPMILGNLTAGSGETVRQYLMSFAENLHAGAMGIVGLGFLILTVVGLLTTIEAAFNDIWGIKQTRPFMRRITSYWTLVTIGPLFVAISIGASASLQSSHFVKTYLLSNDLLRFGIKMTPYLLTWVLFTMLYLFMPNTKVKVRSAFLGGVMAGTLFEVAKYGYTAYTASSVKYHAIYGSLGALPIFLIWIYLTWVIVLVGAEIAFSDQHLDTYRDERRTATASQQFKEFLALNLVAYLSHHYEHQQGAVSSRQISAEFKIPIRLINEVLFNLSCANIVLAVGEDEQFYCPAKPIHQITVNAVLDSLRSVGETPIRLKMTRYEKYFKSILTNIEKAAHVSSGKKNFKQIIADIGPDLKLAKK